MSKEILAIPEQYLNEVILIIRAGLRCVDDGESISHETREQLTKWCDEEEEYLNGVEIETK